MPRIDYRSKSERIRNRYLYPERDDATLSDILIPAAEYAAFFTPLGGKIVGALGRGIGGIFGRFFRGKGRPTTKAINKIIGHHPGRMQKVIEGATGSDFNAGSSWAGLPAVAKTAWRSGGRAGFGGFWGKYFGRVEGNLAGLGRFISRHPGKIALAGGALGALSAMRQGPKAEPIADIGMGYPPGTTWVKQKRKRMRPGRLGSSGDLVFALRGAR